MPEPAKCPDCGVVTTTPHCERAGCPWVDCRPCEITINPRAIKLTKVQGILVDAAPNTFLHMPTQKP